MIHTAAVPRPVRVGLAAAGVAGALALAGCAPADTVAETDRDTTPEATPAATTAPDPATKGRTPPPSRSRPSSSR